MKTERGGENVVCVCLCSAGVPESRYLIFKNKTCVLCEAPYLDDLDTWINLTLDGVPTTADKAK